MIKAHKKRQPTFHKLEELDKNAHTNQTDEKHRHYSYQINNDILQRSRKINLIYSTTEDHISQRNSKQKE